MPRRSSIEMARRRSTGATGRMMIGGAEEQVDCKDKAFDLIEGTRFTTVMTILTVYALFGDDMRMWLFPKAADPVFVFLSTISFIMFCVELSLNVWVKTECGAPHSDISSWLNIKLNFEGYLFSFFFWLDLAAAISLLPEITFIWDPLMGDSVGTGSLAAARAGRLSRAASKAGRIVRMVRLLKLYLKKKQEGEDDVLIEAVAASDDEVECESRVGGRLADYNTRKTIIGVLVLLIVIPFLTGSDIDLSESSGTEYIHDMNLNREPGWYNGVPAYMNSLGLQVLSDEYLLVYLEILPEISGNNLTGVVLNRESFWSDLRDSANSQELVKYKYSGTRNGITYTTEAWFNQQPALSESSGYNIILTLIVAFLLGTGSFLFMKDAQEWVLKPLESMIMTVKEISEDPLKEHTSSTNQGQFETRLLENAIKKIGGLLRVGFGAAGARIIRRNMELGSAFNPMVMGRRLYCIFAFCDIRNFTDTTEVLQEDVLAFVNIIAKVVHDTTVEWGGAPNKNVGDAFLLAWVVYDPVSEIEEKYKREEEEEAERAATTTSNRRKSIMSFTGKGGRDDPSFDFAAKKKQEIDALEDTVDLEKMPHVRETADKALISVLKSLLRMRQTRKIVEYDDNAALNERMPGYTVRLGWGLNVGWCIEGAIGSAHKVDATYLSPNVNLTECMEGATKAYGVPLLMTEPFHRLLSTECKKFTRKMDRVLIPGQKLVISLFTYDFFDPKVNTHTGGAMENVAMIYDCQEAAWNQADEDEKERLISVTGGADIREHVIRKSSIFKGIWSADPELKGCRFHITAKFRKVFAEGIKLYLAGKWVDARDALETAQQLMPYGIVDGGCVSILQYLEENEYVCPTQWPGYRPLPG